MQRDCCASLLDSHSRNFLCLLFVFTALYNTRAGDIDMDTVAFLIGPKELQEVVLNSFFIKWP